MPQVDATHTQPIGARALALVHVPPPRPATVEFLSQISVSPETYSHFIQILRKEHFHLSLTETTSFPIVSKREVPVTREAMDGWGRAGGKVEAATIDRIMLGFRPIAPRPEDAGPGGSRSGDWNLMDAGKKGMAVASKYRAGRKKRRDDTRVRKKSNPTIKIRGSKKINNNMYIDFARESGYLEVNQPKIESVERRLSKVRKGGDDRTDGSGMVVETWLTIERVMITEGMISAGFGSGSLDEDMCPIFVTDDRVKGVEWVNEAYKRMAMVGVGPASVAAEVRVGLGVKEGLQVPSMGSTTASFTCWVRVEFGGYMWRKEGRWSRTVPCDVWMMVECGGGLAWRMDVKAALGLAL